MINQMNKLRDFGKKAVLYGRVLPRYEERHFRSYPLKLQKHRAEVETSKAAIRKIPEKVISSEGRRMVEEIHALNKMQEEKESKTDESFKPISKEAQMIMKIQHDEEEKSQIMETKQKKALPDYRLKFQQIPTIMKSIGLKTKTTIESFTTFFNRKSPSCNNSWTYEALSNFNEISPAVQTHLKQVYLTLSCAVFTSGVGAYLHILGNMGGYVTLGGTLGCIVWIALTPPSEERKRVSLLMAAALLQGITIGPLIELAIAVDPSILASAFVGTGIAFGCFSGAAMLAKRREYLYLGGVLSSGLSILLWLQLASFIFEGSIALFELELYMGLLVFVGYMVVDTQDIIERAHKGDLDYVKHALTLYTDFVAVFVRILIIMLKIAAQKERMKRGN